MCVCVSTHQMLQTVVCLGDRGRAEGVGLDDIRASLQILLVDVLNHIRTSQSEQIVVALQGLGVVLELLACVLGFRSEVVVLRVPGEG